MGVYTFGEVLASSGLLWRAFPSLTRGSEFRAPISPPPSIVKTRHPRHAAAVGLDHQQDLAAPGRGVAQDGRGAGGQGLDDLGAAGAADAEEGEEVLVRHAEIVVGVDDDGAGGEQVGHGLRVLAEAVVVEAAGEGFGGLGGGGVGAAPAGGRRAAGPWS